MRAEEPYGYAAEVYRYADVKVGCGEITGKFTHHAFGNNVKNGDIIFCQMSAFHSVKEFDECKNGMKMKYKYVESQNQNVRTKFWALQVKKFEDKGSPGKNIGDNKLKKQACTQEKPKKEALIHNSEYCISSMPEKEAQNFVVSGKVFLIMKQEYFFKTFCKRFRCCEQCKNMQEED